MCDTVNVEETLQVNTATDNTTESNENREKLTNKAVLVYLAEKFPRCFVLEGEAKPLKINIFQDLVKALDGDNTVSRTQLRQVLRIYTTNWRYLYGCREGAERIDLDGNPCGILETEHVVFAQTQLAEAKAKMAKKRQEQKEVNKKEHKLRHYKAFSSKTIRQKYQPLDAEKVAQLIKGMRIKVKAGERIQNAMVLEPAKDETIRVQLNNGLIINLNTDRLLA